MAHMGKVIVVNPTSRTAAERLGFEPAPSMQAAIGMATDFVGRNPTMYYFHCPPVIMCSVG
jgi:hypothetical protein